MQGCRVFRGVQSPGRCRGSRGGAGGSRRSRGGPEVLGGKTAKNAPDTCANVYFISSFCRMAASPGRGCRCPEPDIRHEGGEEQKQQLVGLWGIERKDVDRIDIDVDADTDIDTDIRIGVDIDAH